MSDHESIPSLDLLGDRLEAAAARAIESRHAPGRRPAGTRSPFGSRWVLVPALAALVLVALVASVVLTTGDDRGSTALADVTSAMRTSAGVSTARFHLVVDVDRGNGPDRVEADGAFDARAGRWSETLDATALLTEVAPSAGALVPASGVQAKLVVDHGTIYASLPGLPGLSGPATGSSEEATWFRLGGPPAEGGATVVSDAGDPSDLLDLFGGVENVQRVGGDPIDGVIATHYRGNIDLDRAYSHLSDADRKRVESSLGIVGGSVPAAGRVPVDVWVDDSGLVRRISSSMALAGSRASFTIDFRDWGAPVEITVPAASQVKPFPSIGAALDPTTTTTTR